MLQIQIQNQVFEVSGLINVTPVNPPPAAPSNLDIADASAPGSVNLLWDNHAAPPYSTEIWRSDNGAAYVLIDTVPAGATTYSDATYPNTPGGYSEYQVRAVNGPLNSTFSNVRGVATTLGDLGLTIYNFPTIRVHFGDVLLGIVAKVFLLPTLREIRGGGFISSAPLSGLDLSQLVFVDSGFTLGNSDLFSITLAALQTVNVGDVRFADNANLVDLSLPLLSFVIGDFINTGCPALTTAAFPGLDTVNGSVDFSGDAQLQQLDLSLLGIIGGACFLNDLTALASLPTCRPLVRTCGSITRQVSARSSSGASVLSAALCLYPTVQPQRWILAASKR